MPFDKKFDLAWPMVVIKHAGGKNLRIDPDNEDNLDDGGGEGKFARFLVKKPENGIVEIMAKKTGKYIRIVGDGDEINCSGGGGKYTPFKVHEMDDGSVKLESVAYEGKYISVFGGKVKVGTGGKFCKLEFFTE